MPTDEIALGATDALVNALRVDDDLDLSDHDPRATFGWKRELGKAAFQPEMDEVRNLQKRLFAEGRQSLLVVLQAMDAGGKDGTIRSVFAGLNPAGVDVNPFGVPSEEERGHDFLWRIHAHAPVDGMIGVFNRSHYEDVLVVRVKQLVEERVWRRRYDHIVNFERLLVDEGTHVVKLFLNVSKDEQRERFQDRVDDPDERWKFRLGDLDDRVLWDEFMAAYTDALERTSTADAPWYVIPADRKWVRNLCVAKVLRSHLERIDPQYPPADEDIAGVVVE